ncbi:MAG: SEC-C metal-binding domain-containing protein [Chitinispirillaceae bacterium]|jgi:hypothetical protein
MFSDFKSLTDDFLLSQQFLFIDPDQKPHAEKILGVFAEACRVRSGCSPEAFSITDLEEILLNRMTRIDTPLSVRRIVPELLRGFFDYLAQSGRYPPAGAWTGWVSALEEQYQSKFRDDGSVRGETFRKRYTDVNRNDPCPCGSGKKFKKCCMNIIF